MTVWKQQRPDWCPHQDCAYRASSQGVVCVGELPAPSPHEGDFNTHRFCMTHSCEGDEPWLIKLEIHRSDACGITRVLNKAFGLTAIADTHAKRGDVEQAPSVMSGGGAGTAIAKPQSRNP